jgi:hypothetical protein
VTEVAKCAKRTWLLAVAILRFYRARLFGLAQRPEVAPPAYS